MTSSIELDSVAFDTFFPVAGLPPAEQAHPRPLTTQAELAASPPAPAPDGPPPEEAEQQRPLLLLPDEPQFEEGPRKWRPEEAQIWFRNVRKTHPKKPGENKSAYARRLHEHMKNDFEEIPWTEWGTLLRRLNDPASEDD